jgi:hypothetical protein
VEQDSGPGVHRSYREHAQACCCSVESEGRIHKVPNIIPRPSSPYALPDRYRYPVGLESTALHNHTFISRSLRPQRKPGRRNIVWISSGMDRPSGCRIMSHPSKRCKAKYRNGIIANRISDCIDTGVTVSVCVPFDSCSAWLGT